VKLATWNINSIKARLPTALEVLRALDADVVCLQELKCEDHAFPRTEIEELGYNVETFGQKTYNGVAILSRFPVSDVLRGLPGFQDVQSRYIEAVIEAPSPVRVASIYAPNGNPVDSEKYPYKLAFLDALSRQTANLLRLEEPVALLGDYNIIPRDADCHDPHVWATDALALPASRAAFRAILHQGYTEAFMARDARPGQYTFWDYQAGAWAKDHGIRIDHALLSPQAADRLTATEIHRGARGLEKPSDHVPFAITLRD
jgi:exodeoxyribonuclease-3